MRFFYRSKQFSISQRFTNFAAAVMM